MHTHPFDLLRNRIEAGDWEGVADLMLSSAEILAAAGADFVICPDNTIHQAFDLVESRSPVPWLNIAREVALEAKRRRCTCLGIMGTRFLMEGPVYPEQLSRVGIEHRIPTAGERDGSTTSSSMSCSPAVARTSLAYLLDVIGGLAGQGWTPSCSAARSFRWLLPRSSPRCRPWTVLRLLARSALNRSIGDAPPGSPASR